MMGAYQKGRMLVAASLLASVGCISIASAQGVTPEAETPVKSVTARPASHKPALAKPALAKAIVGKPLQLQPDLAKPGAAKANPAKAAPPKVVAGPAKGPSAKGQPAKVVPAKVSSVNAVPAQAVPPAAEMRATAVVATDNQPGDPAAAKIAADKIAAAVLAKKPVRAALKPATVSVRPPARPMDMTAASESEVTALEPVEPTTVVPKTTAAPKGSVPSKAALTPRNMVAAKVPAEAKSPVAADTAEETKTADTSAADAPEAVKAPPVRAASRKAPRPLDLSSGALRRPVGASLVGTLPKSAVAKALDVDKPSVTEAVPDVAASSERNRVTAFAPAPAVEASGAGATSAAAQSVLVKGVSAPSLSAKAAVSMRAAPLKVALAEPGEPAGRRSLTDASPAGGDVHALIAHHAAANGVPVALATAVVRVESRFNPRARNGVNVGLTQISTATARALGYQGGAQGLMDADTNLRFGIRYLAQAYRLAGGDTCRTVLKYQAGHRASTMTGAARAYCAKVMPHVSRR